MRQTSNKNLPGSTGSNKWIQNDRNKYMVGLNHQQCKTIFTERFRLSPSSEFTGKKIKISTFLQVNQENTK